MGEHFKDGSVGSSILPSPLLIKSEVSMKYLNNSIEPRCVTKNKFVGEINIPDGKIDITDPGYDNDTWCAMFNYEIKAGKYKCFIEKINFPYLVQLEDEDVSVNSKAKSGDVVQRSDIRITALRIVHENESLNFGNYKTISQNIGVDSGMCGFYNHKPNFDDQKWQNFCDECGYGLTCLCKPNGITVSSGFGDGCYTLREKRDKKNQVVALELLFY